MPNATKEPTERTSMGGWKLKDKAYLYHATEDTIHEVVVVRFKPGRINSDTKAEEPITYWSKDDCHAKGRCGHAPLEGKLFRTMEGACDHRKEVIENEIKGVDTVADLLDFIQVRLHCALSSTNKKLQENAQLNEAILPGSVILDPFTQALVTTAIEKIKGKVT